MSGPRLSRTAHVSPRKPIASAVAFGQSRQVMARGEGKSKGGPFIEISCKAWSSEKILELAGLSGCAGLRQRLTAPPREAKKARAGGRQAQAAAVSQCLAMSRNLQGHTHQLGPWHKEIGKVESTFACSKPGQYRELMST